MFGDPMAAGPLSMYSSAVNSSLNENLFISDLKLLVGKIVFYWSPPQREYTELYY